VNRISHEHCNMDVTDLTPKLDALETSLDELEEALGPLLHLGEASSRLPLLDKAKLNILSTYALETLLFCT
jgi:exosome complex protein LRP1